MGECGKSTLWEFIFFRECFVWSPSTLLDPPRNPGVLTTITVLTDDLMSAASSLCAFDYSRRSSRVSPCTLWCHPLSGTLPETLSKHPASLRLATALISSTLWAKPCSRVPMCLTYNLPVWLWLSCAFLYICARSLPIWDDYRPAIGCHAHAPSDGPVNHHSIFEAPLLLSLASSRQTYVTPLLMWLDVTPSALIPVEASAPAGAFHGFDVTCELLQKTAAGPLYLPWRFCELYIFNSSNSACTQKPPTHLLCDGLEWVILRLFDIQWKDPAEKAHDSL